MNWLTILKYLPTIAGAIWAAIHAWQMKSSTLPPQFGSWPADMLVYLGGPMLGGVSLSLGGAKLMSLKSPAGWLAPVPQGPVSVIDKHVQVLGAELGTAGSRGDVKTAKIILTAIESLKAPA